MSPRRLPTLGLAVIARNEEASLPRLLASAAGAFDQVALLDTGSEDRTVDVFEAWARRNPMLLGHRVGRFEWCDDFAAARNAANALLETDWLAWADCDEAIDGARHLRTIAATVPSDVVQIDFAFRYGGATQSRERLARRGFEYWVGRVCEGQPAMGARWEVGRHRTFHCNPVTAVVWVHSAPGERALARFGPKYERNMTIAEQWRDDRPGNPGPVSCMATEELYRGSREASLRRFAEYLAMPRVQAAYGAERIEKATAALSLVDVSAVAATDYVLGKDSALWDDDAWPTDLRAALADLPLCPDPGPAVIDPDWHRSGGR
jgi:hypothetical protein